MCDFTSTTEIQNGSQRVLGNEQEPHIPHQFIENLLYESEDANIPSQKLRPLYGEEKKLLFFSNFKCL